MINSIFYSSSKLLSLFCETVLRFRSLELNELRTVQNRVYDIVITKYEFIIKIVGKMMNRRRETFLL